MNRYAVFSAAIIMGLVFSSILVAQTDDVSAATGLPIPIGSPVIYGQVVIEGLPREERRPNIFVSLLISGSEIDRRQTDSRGYFFFLVRPRHGHTLLFQVDGSEVGRAYLTVGTGDRLRQDVTLDWRALRGAKEGRRGVIAAPGYIRTAEAEKSFDKAMQAIRENKNSLALELFKEILANDNNDYLAWTMLGTLYYADKKYSDAAPAFKKALELKPDLTVARVNLGKMELSQKNFEKAIETLQRAVELDPTSADANHFLGEAYLQIKKGSLAVGFLNKAIELAPAQKAEIHLRLAALYNGAGAKDRAAAEYKAFLIKVPDHPDRTKFEKYIIDNSPR
jgi:Tfp pilus assembly protein PilF